MKLKTDGLLTRFYARTYGLEDSQLPQNFCQFFWLLVAAFAALTLTWWTYFCERQVKQPWELSPGMPSRLMAGIITPIALAALLGGVFGIGCAFYYHAYITSGIISGVVLVVAGAWFLFNGAEDSVAADLAHDIGTVVSAKWESTKENYCPKIDWE